METSDRPTCISLELQKLHQYDPVQYGTVPPLPSLTCLESTHMFQAVERSMDISTGQPCDLARTELSKCQLGHTKSSKHIVRLAACQLAGASQVVKAMWFMLALLAQCPWA